MFPSSEPRLLPLHGVISSTDKIVKNARRNPLVIFPMCALRS